MGNNKRIIELRTSRVEPPDPTKLPYKGNIFFLNCGRKVEGHCRYINQGLNGSENCGYRNSNTLFFVDKNATGNLLKVLFMGLFGNKISQELLWGAFGLSYPAHRNCYPCITYLHWRGEWRISVTPGSMFPITSSVLFNFLRENPKLVSIVSTFST